MKKQSLGCLLAAGAILIFASACQQKDRAQTRQEQENNDEEIDQEDSCSSCGTSGCSAVEQPAEPICAAIGEQDVMFVEESAVTTATPAPSVETPASSAVLETPSVSPATQLESAPALTPSDTTSETNSSTAKS